MTRPRDGAAARAAGFRVRRTRPEDFPGIVDLTRRVYPGAPPWSVEQLSSHRRVFPEGQMVAEAVDSGEIVGMTASLVVTWDDYDTETSWRDFTEKGTFANHDPAGRTLYGAEVMVAPRMQGRSIGTLLYAARRDLVRRLGLLRIRAGARLRGYHRVAARMSAERYVVKVVRRELGDPTLSFQLRQGFRVIAVVPGYLVHDPASQGWAAVIEWLNPEVAKPDDWRRRNPLFSPPHSHYRLPTGWAAAGD